MRLALCALVAFLLGACSMGNRRPPAEPELYLVRARGAEAPAPTSERAIIRVAPVGVAAHIRGVTIVTDDGRVRTMVNQRFAAPLDALVEDAVTDRLRASGRYGVVLSPAHATAAPFVLRLTLRAFEIAVTDSGYAARVTFDGLVEREADRRVVRSFRASADRAANGPEGGGFVRGLEDALNGAIDVVLQELEAAGVDAAAELLPPSEKMATTPYFDLGALDLTKHAIPVEEVRRIVPHRHELALLDAIVHHDPETMDAVGYHDVRADAFWVRGHIPGDPIFPGALMVEAAAQLSSFCYGKRVGPQADRFFGFGAIDKVKFRSIVRPGQRLYLLCKNLVFERRYARYGVQGIADDVLCFEGQILGVSMPSKKAP